MRTSLGPVNHKLGPSTRSPPASPPKGELTRPRIRPSRGSIRAIEKGRMLQTQKLPSPVITSAGNLILVPRDLRDEAPVRGVDDRHARRDRGEGAAVLTGQRDDNGSDGCR